MLVGTYGAPHLKRADMSGSLTVVNALVFDGESADLMPADLRVVGGTIVEIGGGLGTGDGPVIDARGNVVTPGFIDAHFHAYGIDLNMLRMEASPRSYVALLGAVRLRRALKRGFTAVRDVAGGDIGLARAIHEELLPSPRYFYTGPALSQTGGHGDPRDANLDLCCGSHVGVEVVDGVDALRTAVRERLRTGAHAIKIMASGGVVSLTDPIRVPQYSADEVRVVADEADRRGSYVAAHAYSPESIVHAVANGVRSIEHGNLMEPETARFMADHDAVLVPTLVTYLAMRDQGAQLGMAEVAMRKNTEVLEAGKRAIEVAMAAGVNVGFGTDLMGSLESEQLRGLQVQHEVQGTLELLRSVTSRNADVLRMPELGRLRVGAAGDMVVLDGNPFEHPGVLWEHSEGRMVIQAGTRVA